MAPQPAAAGSPFRFVWAPALWIGLCLFLCFFPVLKRLFDQWMAEEAMSHGIFVPFVAGFIAWQRRHKVFGLAPRPSNWGLGLMAAAGAMCIVANLAAELFFARLAVVLSLVGAILFLRGAPAVRALAFPLLLLLFMIPIPSFLYKELTLPLQLLASDLAERTIDLLGYSVLREGNLIELSGQQLSVVEACSGIRSLMTLSFFSLTYAYLVDSRVWVRWVLLFITVPVAIVANAGRIVLTAVVGEYNKEMAQGVFHAASGWVIFVLAIVIMMGFHWLMTRVFPRQPRRAQVASHA